jgi:hypothetical protein
LVCGLSLPRCLSVCTWLSLPCHDHESTKQSLNTWNTTSWPMTEMKWKISKWKTSKRKAQQFAVQFARSGVRVVPYLQSFALLWKNSYDLFFSLSWLL